MKSLTIILLLQTVASFGQAFQINHVARPNGARGVVAPSSVKKMMADQRGLNGARGGTPSPSSLRMSAKTSNQHERRSFIENVAQSIIFSSVGSASASAENGTNLPKITHTVFMDVRISRADGSFYVRDATPSDLPADEPFYAQLVLGLFGNQTPNHVQQFLNYVDVRYDVDNPLPSYSRSKFGTLDTANGLLIGGTIPGLDVTTLAGGSVLEYSGRVIPAKLWLEVKNASNDAVTTPKLSHDIKGLLTHRNFDLTPSFGITTRNKSTSLDATHTIFGCILEDKSGFLDKVVDLPVLTDQGRVSRTANEPVNVGGNVGGGSLASSIFTAQRTIFRDAAKTFGDSRLDKVYDGKILRRIEVTKVGVL